MNTHRRNQTPETKAKSREAQASTSAGGFDIHQQITNTIIEAMEQAKGTGKRLWDSQPSLPLNFTTNTPYQGINTLILWAAGLKHGYRSPYWLTYKQAAERGGQVRKGEHGETCVFYKPWEQEQTVAGGETEIKRGAVLKSFRVFNLDQVDGITAPAKEERPAFVTIEAAERLLSASPARVEIGGTQAFYRPSDDTIHLPARAAFIHAEAFYSVALHEMTHASGHPSRLARDFSGRFGTEAYAFEELIAELGSAFLNADLGILNTTLPDHADYLASWVRILKSDKKAILTAAAQAAKAHAFIKGLVERETEAAA